MNKAILKEFFCESLLSKFKAFNAIAINNKEVILLIKDGKKISLGFPIVDYRPEYRVGFVVCIEHSKIEEIANRYYFSESQLKKSKFSATLCENIAGYDHKSGSYEYYKIHSIEEAELLLNKISTQIFQDVTFFANKYSNINHIEEYLNRTYIENSDAKIGTVMLFKGLVAARLLHKEYFLDLVRFYVEQIKAFPNLHFGVYPDKINKLIEYLKSEEFNREL